MCGVCVCLKLISLFISKFHIDYRISKASLFFFFNNLKSNETYIYMYKKLIMKIWNLMRLREKKKRPPHHHHHRHHRLVCCIYIIIIIIERVINIINDDENLVWDDEEVFFSHFKIFFSVVGSTAIIINKNGSIDMTNNILFMKINREREWEGEKRKVI